MALLNHPASGQLGNAGVPAPWLFRADRCRRGAPTARLYAHSMWLTAERVREENSSKGEDMASITRRSRDIPGTYALSNISRNVPDRSRPGRWNGPPPRRRWLRRKPLLQGDFFELAGPFSQRKSLFPGPAHLPVVLSAWPLIYFRARMAKSPDLLALVKRRRRACCGVICFLRLGATWPSKGPQRPLVILVGNSDLDLVPPLMVET